MIPVAGSASLPNDASYSLQSANSPFSFTLTRNGSSSNEAPLFSTKGQGLIFMVPMQTGLSPAVLAFCTGYDDLPH